MGGSDIDRRKFCRYVRENLFRKSRIVKRGSENLAVNYIGRNKLVIDNFRKKCKRAKK